MVSGREQEPFSLAVDGGFIYWSDWSSSSLWRVAVEEQQEEAEPELVRSFPKFKPHGVAALPTSPLVCKTQKLSLDTGTSKATTLLPTTAEQEEQEEPDSEEEQEPDSQEETGSCTNWCLAGGSCVLLEGEPECLCVAGREGARCQLEVIQEHQGEVEQQQQQKLHADSFLLLLSPPSLHLLVYGLAATMAVLLIAVLLLSLYVVKLRRRPRVRKRFIQGTAGRGVRNGGLEVKDSCGGAEDGVTLDIENCCNMTLCDTVGGSWLLQLS